MIVLLQDVKGLQYYDDHQYVKQSYQPDNDMTRFYYYEKRNKSDSSSDTSLLVRLDSSQR